MKLIYNAKIYTSDTEHPTASALIVDGKRLHLVGGEELCEYPVKKKENMAGQAILPGLTDGHIHLQQYVLNLNKVDCETKTLEECLVRISDRVKKTKPHDWILGHGWNQNDWLNGFGNAADLDAVVPDHPVYLTAKSLHAGWANSTALKLAGVTSTTPDPKDGKIQRDGHNRPTGILLEKAMKLVESIIPEPDVKTLADLIHKALPSLHRMGITGIHEFDRYSCYQAMKALNAQGALTLRILKNIHQDDFEQAVSEGLYTDFGDEKFRIGSVKVFADGALGPHTAALLEPYSDELENYGILNLTAAEFLEQYGRSAVDSNFSLAVHAIGDRTNREMLDGFEILRRDEQSRGKKNLRHRIEHAQLLHALDIPRFTKLGIIPSMQPIHATSDMPMAERLWGDRCCRAYAVRSQLESGANLVFGSDAPVESPNPFLGLHAAVTRSCIDGSPGEAGWYPEQRIKVGEAIKGFTSGPAYAANLDNQLGCLKAGYLADLVVVDKDPFDCDPQEIAYIRPRAVMVDGDWVWKE